MAGVMKKDIPQIAAFMQDFWALAKKYWIPENTDTYWETLINDCRRLSQKYTDPFAEDMLITFINNREKEGKKKCMDQNM